MKTVEVVVPCYNEEAMLNMFYVESEKIYKTIDGYRLVIFLSMTVAGIRLIPY